MYITNLGEVVNQLKGISKRMNRDDGISISTVSFSSANVLLFSGSVELLGFIASTATADVYIDFRTTGTLVTYSTTNIMLSVPLSTGSSGTTYKFPYAIKTDVGWSAKMNVNTVRFVTYIYRKIKNEWYDSWSLNYSKFMRLWNLFI
mgnify:CR=1 FL=1